MLNFIAVDRASDMSRLAKGYKLGKDFTTVFDGKSLFRHHFSTIENLDGPMF